MKKVLLLVAGLAFALLPEFVSAGYSGGNSHINIMTRLEISKDGTNWINYAAEENSGSQTLTVSPGDTVYLRLKTWNTGDQPAANIQYTSSWTNPNYIDAIDPFEAGVNDDLDGDATYYYKLSGLPDMTAGTMDFTLDAVDSSTTIDSGYQGGEIVARVKTGTPDQTVISMTVQVTSSQLIAWWQRVFLTRAYADNQATTQIKMLVSNPIMTTPAITTLPVTGADL